MDENVFASGVWYQNVKLEVVNSPLDEEKTGAIIIGADKYLTQIIDIGGVLWIKGGNVIREQCHEHIKNGPIEIGEVFVSGAGNLDLKYIIHAVVPDFSVENRNNDELLRKAIYNSLCKANDLEVGSITLPLISSYFWQNPQEKCADIMMRTIMQFIDDMILNRQAIMIKYIRLTNFENYFADPINKFFRIYFLAQDSIDIKSNKEYSKKKIEKKINNNNKACCLML